MKVGSELTKEVKSHQIKLRFDFENFHARLESLQSARNILHTQELTQFSIQAVQFAMNKRSIV